MADKLEEYYQQEEKDIRKLGMDPMEVPQVEPKKMPTHYPGATLQRGKKATTRYAEGGMVKLKHKAEPYLPGRTRMPFEIPLPEQPKPKAKKFNKGGMVKGQCRDYGK
jgi:hypothetical protein